MNNADSPLNTKSRGHYLGTEIEEIWWRRYRKNGLFARGNGEYWLDGDYLNFRRYLTRTPIVIDLSRMIELKLGTWHAGRWAAGLTVFKFLWKKDGLLLSSGFILSKDPAEVQRLADHLRQRIAERRTPPAATPTSSPHNPHNPQATNRHPRSNDSRNGKSPDPG